MRSEAGKVDYTVFVRGQDSQVADQQTAVAARVNTG